MVRRVVITGLGVISPLGNRPDKLWEALESGTSGVRELTSVPRGATNISYGAEARDFTGAIEDFGALEKTMARNIKKNLKVMCREMQIGIAAAQLALSDSGLKLDDGNRDRVGCVCGSEYMLTMPQEFTAGIRSCVDGKREFDFTDWAEKGLPAVEPLWLLKYLPNLPASHFAIFNDLRGPNNSLTMREASSNLAVAEAAMTIARGHADAMIAGATGTKIHPTRMIHAPAQEEVAVSDADPQTLSRPFDRGRLGCVLGEGAAAVMLEEAEQAERRGATVYGEVIGFASSAVSRNSGADHLRTALHNVLAKAMETAGLNPREVGHIHAHGLSGKHSDAAESQAISEVFRDRQDVPVVAAKSYFGNLGAASGLVELGASLLAMRQGKLFRTLNYEKGDSDCPLAVVKSNDVPAGETFINVNCSPQGQASAVVVRRYAGR